MKEAQFKQMMNALGPTEGIPPKRHTWDRHRWEIRRHAKRDDPQKFLQWSTLTATMFVGAAPYIEDEFAAISGNNRWLYAIREPGFGDPHRLPYCEEASGNLVHQAYHLMKWEAATGQQIGDMKSIVEFGAGYGAMTQVTYQAGYEGEYWLYDLPEFLLLQQFWLSNIREPWEPYRDYVFCDINEWGYRLPLPTPDLVIGCWSLSETSLEQRDDFVNVVSPKSWLLTYQPTWQGISNDDYFAAFTQARPEYDWVIEKACMNSKYLFGVKK